MRFEKFLNLTSLWHHLAENTKRAKSVSMITLMDHISAKPRECSLLPKELMSTNNFFIGLVRVANGTKKQGPFLENKVFKGGLIKSQQ